MEHILCLWAGPIQIWTRRSLKAEDGKKNEPSNFAAVGSCPRRVWSEDINNDYQWRIIWYYNGYQQSLSDSNHGMLQYRWPRKVKWSGSGDGSCSNLSKEEANRKRSHQIYHLQSATLWILYGRTKAFSPVTKEIWFFRTVYVKCQVHCLP